MVKFMNKIYKDLESLGLLNFRITTTKADSETWYHEHYRHGYSFKLRVSLPSPYDPRIYFSLVVEDFFEFTTRFMFGGYLNGYILNDKESQEEKWEAIKEELLDVYKIR